MRAAAILGLGASTHDLTSFQQGSSVEWMIGLPADGKDLDAILVFGGDGTVHRHLDALVKLGLPVLVVPAGSGNDLARALGLLKVRDSVAAWRKFVATQRNVRSIDLGWITPQEHSGTQADSSSAPGSALPTRYRRKVYFSCVAGVGLDGEIARRANALPRWLRAHGGYALSLPPAVLRFRSFLLQLSTTSSDSTSEARALAPKPVLLAVFANTPVYGDGMKVAPRACMDDGLLDVCVIRNLPKLKLLTVFPTVYFGRHLGIREVEYFTSSSLRVETDRTLDIYADGEYVCRTPIEIGVAEKALQVIVPA
jgi:diacylglycerol kinase (ATP)